jgi:hypothetical protein
VPAQVQLELDFIERGATTTRAVVIRKAVVGGWTGRDKAALQHHIDELAKIGVRPPERTPMFYRVSVTRIVHADDIEVIGDGSSGEVEYVLLKSGGRIWVGAGSDHTDRAVEHMGITIAKQLCDKPIARTFWPLDEVETHWDALTLSSYIEEAGSRVLYQSGKVSALLSPRELLAHYEEGQFDLEEGALIFGGTCGAIGGVRFSRRFSFELIDPVLVRSIAHSYGVQPLPIRG